MLVDKKELKVHKRHQRIWTFLWHTLGWIFKLIHSYSCEPAPKIKGPCIILSNHTMELDPVLLALSFKRQMYFVASEHVYRKGWVSRLLFWAFEPIAKIKGASDTLTVMKAIRKLKNGFNVCIFAEGSRSFDGRNSPVPQATGKLVRTSGASLITYRIEGGYLTNPRWGFGIRRGKSFGHVVNVYESEKIKEMTVDEINRHIVEDIHEDAYARQAEKALAYKGKNLALGMECAYCICPKCHSLGKIKTEGDAVFCTACGNKTTFDEYGFFTGDFGLKNTAEWEDFQEKEFDALVKTSAKGQEEPYFWDDGILMRTVDSEHNEKELGQGKMSLYRDRFVFESLDDSVSQIVLPISRIPDMSVYSRNGFVFTDSEGTHYEIKPTEKKSPLNVRKYISVWKRLRENKSC